MARASVAWVTIANSKRWGGPSPGFSCRGLCVTRHAGPIPLQPLGSDACEIPALTEGVQRIRRQSPGDRPFADYRANVSGESILETILSIDQCALLLRDGQLLLIHQ